MKVTLIQLATDREWEAARQTRVTEHHDVAQAIHMLKRKKIIRVKFPCPIEDRHKKRDAIRQSARAQGLKIETRWKDGWVLVAKVGI